MSCLKRIVIKILVYVLISFIVPRNEFSDLVSQCRGLLNCNFGIVTRIFEDKLIGVLIV